MNLLFILISIIPLRVHGSLNYGFVTTSESMRGGASTGFSIAHSIGNGWYGGGSIRFSKYIALGEGDYRQNFIGAGFHLEGRPLGTIWHSLWFAADFSVARSERRRGEGKEYAFVPQLSVNPYLLTLSKDNAAFTLETVGVVSPGKKHQWVTLGFGIGVVFEWPQGLGQK